MFPLERMEKIPTCGSGMESGDDWGEGANEACKLISFAEVVVQKRINKENECPTTL